MAIGGISSIRTKLGTVNFRRPRGRKGIVADIFHKIGQVDVKTRQLNNVLNTVDKSVNLLGNVQRKIAAGELTGGNVGFKIFRGFGQIGNEIGDVASDIRKGGIGGIKKGLSDLWRGGHGRTSDGGSRVGTSFDGFAGIVDKLKGFRDEVSDLTRPGEYHKQKMKGELGQVIEEKLGQGLADASAGLHGPIDYEERLRRKIHEGTLPEVPKEFEKIATDYDKAINALDSVKAKLEKMENAIAGKGERLKKSEFREMSNEAQVAIKQFDNVRPRLSKIKDADFLLGRNVKSDFDDFGPQILEHSKKLKDFKLNVRRAAKAVKEGKKFSFSKFMEGFNKIDAQKASTTLTVMKEKLKELKSESNIALTRMRNDWNKTGKPIRKVARDIDHVDDSVEEVDRSVGKLGNEFKEEFNKITHSVKRMSKATEDLSIQMKRMTVNMNKQFRVSRRNAAGAADSMDTSDVGKGVGGMGLIGYGPLATMSSMYAMAAPYMATQNVIEFSKQMGTIRAETLGTDLDQEKLRDSILTVAGSSRFTATDVAGSVIGAVRSGFRIREELTGIKYLSTLAVAENVDLQEAYSSIEPILNTLNVNLDKLPRIADKLSAATSTGATNLSELGWIAGRGLSVHLETGGGFDEFFAMAPFLRSQGVGRERTATALSNMQMEYMTLATGKGTKTQRETLQKIGVTPQSQFYDEEGKIKSTIEITKVINDAIAKSGANAADTVIGIFNREVGRSVISLFSDKSINEVKSIMSQIGGSQGTTEMKRKTQEQSIYNQFQNIRSAAEEITIRLFGGDEQHLASILERIASSLKRFAVFLKQNAHHINNFFDSISKWFDRNKEKIIKFFRTVGKTVFDVGKTFGKLIAFFTTFILKFQGLFAFFVKWILYMKMFNFFFGGFFSFFLGGLGQTIVMLRTVGLLSLAWSTFLGPVITRLITSNALLRQLSTTFFGLINAQNITDVWGQFLGLKIFRAATLKKGIVSFFKIMVKSIGLGTKLVAMALGTILTVTSQLIGEFFILLGKRIFEVAVSPFINVGKAVATSIAQTNVFQAIVAEFKIIKKVATTTFRNMKLQGASTFMALRVSAVATSKYIAFSFGLAYQNIKRSALSALATIKAASIATGRSVAFSFLHPIATLKTLKLFILSLSFAKIAAGLGSVWTTLKGIVIIGPILKGIAAALSAIGGFISAPFVAIGAAIIGISVLMIRNWEKVKIYFMAVSNFFKALFGFIINGIRFIAHLINAKFPVIGKIFIGIGEKVKGFFVGIWDTLKNIGKWIEDVFVKTLEWATDKFEKMTGWLRDSTNWMRKQMGLEVKETKVEKTEKEIDKKVKETEKERDIFQRKEISSVDTSGITSGTFERSSGPSIEFISFKRMNDLTVTIESGFQQLLNVNSKILDVLSGGGGKILLNEKEKTATILGSTNNSSISKSFSHVTDRGNKGLVATLPSPMNPASVKLPSEQSIELPNAQTIDVPSIKVEGSGPQNNLNPGEGNGVIVQNTFNIQATPDMDTEELAKVISEYIERTQRLNQFGKG